jgi:hypothetical protein
VQDKADGRRQKLHSRDKPGGLSPSPIIAIGCLIFRFCTVHFLSYGGEWNE